MLTSPGENAGPGKVSEQKTQPDQKGQGEEELDGCPVIVEFVVSVVWLDVQ